jgi:hypothetical protein
VERLQAGVQRLQLKVERLYEEVALADKPPEKAPLTKRTKTVQYFFVSIET